LAGFSLPDLSDSCSNQMSFKNPCGRIFPTFLRLFPPYFFRPPVAAFSSYGRVLIENLCGFSRHNIFAAGFSLLFRGGFCWLQMSFKNPVCWTFPTFLRLFPPYFLMTKCGGFFAFRMSFNRKFMRVFPATNFLLRTLAHKIPFFLR
jgi:hypothetical protein